LPRQAKPSSTTEALFFIQANTTARRALDTRLIKIIARHATDASFNIRAFVAIRRTCQDTAAALKLIIFFTFVTFKS
jgi:hypothetical protein